MPVCILHLISLNPPTTTPDFLAVLRSSILEPIVVAKVINWIITPTVLSVNELLHPPSPWDLFLLLPSTDPIFPPKLECLLSAHWSIKVGIPSRLLQDFPSVNLQLLHPDPDTTPSLTGALSLPKIAQSSQSLELSPDLHTWITGSATSELTHNNSTAISMLNLLAFNSGPGANESYLRYGRAFANSIGSRRGGVAKVVGSVLPSSSSSSKNSQKDEAGVKTWDEIAIAHYPSIQHFGDMIASDDYQEVNHRYRVGSLMDTAILCLSEGAVEGLWEKETRIGNGQEPRTRETEEKRVRSKL
jgi:hypothetical protein